MADPQFRTIQDMINNYYGMGGGAFVNKADAPVISTTTGVFQATYGAMAFANINNELNVFAALPKYPWQQSGFRVVTTRATTAATGTVTQAGALPYSIKPTFAAIEVKVAEVVHVFESSWRIEALQRTDDALNLDQLRPLMAAEHARVINEMLLADVDTTLTSGERNGTFETLDRVTASSTGATAGLYTAGDEDLYGRDRSTDTWFNAQISHGSTTDRTLTISIIEDFLFGTLKAAGANPTLIVTGFDTQARIISLAQTQVRYQGVVQQNVAISVGLNGVSPAGIDFGVTVPTLYGIPIIASQDVTKDTISRIYILDTTTPPGSSIPKLGIALLYPTTYYESGVGSANRDPFTIGAMATKGMYYTAGQLVCTVPFHEGSIRDLK